MIAPFYHTVSDTPLPYTFSLYKVRNVRNFNHDLNFMLKHYQPVSLPELIKMVKENTTPAKPVFFLSFDDGLQEFYDIIAPILLKKGVPATCFLNSAFIDNKDLFYRYKAGLLIDALQQKSTNRNLQKKISSWFKKKGYSYSRYKKNLMQINYDQSYLYSELAEILDLSFENFLHTKQPYLTSQQILTLIKKGFTFGAHSVDHPDFRCISTEEQVRQTVESVKTISGKFNLSYQVFSFPFTDYGIQKVFFQMVKHKTDVDLSFGSAAMKHDSIPRHFQRIPMEEYNLHAAKRIKRDYFYFLLKNLFNKNIIVRS